MSTQQGQGWEAIYNIPAITLTWYKPAGQDQLPWQAEHSPDVESPQHCLQENPREGSEISLMYQFAVPVCSLWGWYLEQSDPLATPSLTVVRRVKPTEGIFLYPTKIFKGHAYTI